MRYLGGKNKIGLEISQKLKEILEQNTKKIKNYIEPFCGSLGILKHITNIEQDIYASDLNPDIVLLWKAVQDKTFKKPIVTKENYYSYKKQEPSAERAYVGFARSFNGVWFGSFVDEDNDKIYNNIIKNSDIIKNVNFEYMDYKKCIDKIKHGSFLIYCDPPYKNTNCTFGPKDMNSSLKTKNIFNNDEFWITVTEWAIKYKNIVVVSEFSIPKDIEELGWKCIWNKERTVIINSKKKIINKKVIEKLFMINAL